MRKVVTMALRNARSSVVVINGQHLTLDQELPAGLRPIFDRLTGGPIPTKWHESGLLPGSTR